MIRTPFHLGELRARLIETHHVVLHLYHGLQTVGPTRPLLTRARQRFGATITVSPLRRWRGMDPLVIARQPVARAVRRSDKALRDLLALAERPEEIDMAWVKFLDHLTTLPADRQRALVAALPALVPPASEQAAPPSA